MLLIILRLCISYDVIYDVEGRVLFVGVISALDLGSQWSDMGGGPWLVKET